MRMIKQLCYEINGNICEAREKICTAYKLREKDKALADWYKDMAAQHIAFNTVGHANVKRLIDEAKAKRADDKLMPGMVAVYEDMHADIMRDSAEVQAMIAAYK